MDPVYNFEEGTVCELNFNIIGIVQTSQLQQHVTPCEAISREVVVTINYAYPNHRARTSRATLQSI